MAGMRRKLVVGGIAALAVVGAGGAVAATQWSPKAESDAIVEDAAKQLGVDADDLDAALRNALANRIDEAVTDGRLTEDEAARLKEAIESGDFPVVGGPFGHGFGEREDHVMMFPAFDAAAEYVGISEDELRGELEDGKTLADVAKAHDKSVDGLVDALVEASDARIDEAVEDGRLTKGQADELKAGTRQRMADLVNGALPRFERHGHPGPGLRGIVPGPGPWDRGGSGSDGSSDDDASFLGSAA